MTEQEILNESFAIELIPWDIIEEKFDVDVNVINRELKKPNNCDNFWYPYESGFDEEQCKEAVRLFGLRFPGTEIKSMHDMRYLEIFLNTLEKHQFAYTLIQHIKGDKT